MSHKAIYRSRHRCHFSTLSPSILSFPNTRADSPRPVNDLFSYRLLIHFALHLQKELIPFVAQRQQLLPMNTLKPKSASIQDFSCKKLNQQSRVCDTRHFSQPSTGQYLLPTQQRDCRQLHLMTASCKSQATARSSLLVHPLSSPVLSKPCLAGNGRDTTLSLIAC